MTSCISIERRLYNKGFNVGLISAKRSGQRKISKAELCKPEAQSQFIFDTTSTKHKSSNECELHTVEVGNNIGIENKNIKYARAKSLTNPIVQIEVKDSRLNTISKNKVKNSINQNDDLLYLLAFVALVLLILLLLKQFPLLSLILFIIALLLVLSFFDVI